MKFSRFQFFLCSAIMVLVLFTAFSPSNVSAVFNAYDVLGQFNDDGSRSFTDTAEFSANINARNFGAVGPSLVDLANNRFYVADEGRILVYNLVGGELLDKEADYVLGRSNFTADYADNPVNASEFSGNAITGLALNGSGNRLFAAEFSSCRILVFDVATITNGEPAINVLGAPDLETEAGCSVSSDELNGVNALTYDGANDMLYVADSTRVLVFDFSSGITDGMSASYVLGQPDFVTNNATWPAINSFSDVKGILFDSEHDRLYVGDAGRVMIFDSISSTITNGMNASKILGKANFTAGVDSVPSSSNLYDEGTGGLARYNSGANELLFVADGRRILVFDVTSIINGESAQYVLGQTLFTTSIEYQDNSIASAATFSMGSMPFSINENEGYLYVPDTSASRILVFDVTSITNGEDAVDLLGQANSSGENEFTWRSQRSSDLAKGFSSLQDMIIDEVEHRLFVADSSKVLVFNLDSSNQLINKSADYVLGTENIYKSGSGSGINGINPLSLAYSKKNKLLYVGDDVNHRVTVFDLSSGITNGMNASYVIGASDFDSAGGGELATRFYMYGIHLDDVRDRLYVIDRNNRRGVLVFDVSQGLSNNMAASYVLGEASLNGATGFNYPSATSTGNVFSVASDPGRDLLFVGEEGRVLIFDTSGGISNAMPASYVLGQSVFTSATPGTSQTAIGTAQGLLYDDVNKLLYVSDGEDYGNYRITAYDIENITNNEPAVAVIGKENFTNAGAGTPSQSAFASNGRISFSSTTRTLFVADGGSRILLFSLIDFASDTLSQATVGTAYSHTLTATSSQGTVTYSLVSGTFPDGLSLNESTGAITGTPTIATTSLLRFRVTDTLSAAQVFYHSQDFTLTVNEAPAAEETPANPPANGPVFISSGGGGGFAFPGTVKNYIVPNQETAPVIPSQVPTITTPSTQTPTFAPTNVVTSYFRNLALGNGGEDVRNLQKLLNSLGFTIASSGPGSPGSETTYYGELTRNAVKRLQEANREAILTPSGLTSGTGYFGPATRRYLEGLRF